MTKFNVGDVVICGTGQAGTLLSLAGRDASVLLANTELWHGMDSQMRHPQDEADLAACPLNVERLEPKIIKSPKREF